MLKTTTALKRVAVLVDLERQVAGVKDLGRLTKKIQQEIGRAHEKYAYRQWGGASPGALRDTCRWGYEPVQVQARRKENDKKPPTHISMVIKVAEIAESNEPPEDIVISSRLANSFSFLPRVAHNSNIWLVVPSFETLLEERGCGQIHLTTMETRRPAGWK
eukprot:TRINITY_DN19620_c3_g1_i1.p1 TRINITY_DN19620_c3_g1~~TRINITY_DN19620_c3_g1_i1.p1  ORF type:complete len:177 (+),score=29.60 TRINITY_DN19620_c3_g1_i1:50-532(+)